MAPPPTEDEILERGTALLRSSLPPHWKVQPVRYEERGGDARADVVLRVASPDGEARFVVELARAFAPRDVAAVVRQARLVGRLADDVPVLLMAPWLSERSRALLTAAAINYVDMAGNARVVADHPAMLIERDMNAPAPKRLRPPPSVKGLKAGRVLRLLADVQPPMGVLELAMHAGVTPGYVSRLLERLARDDLITRTRRGGVAEVEWRGVLELRAQTYGVFAAHRLQRYLCPTGAEHALELAAEPPPGGRGYALTGSFAAERLLSIEPPQLLMLYAASEPTALIDRAGLLPAESVANVVIAIPEDQSVMDARWPHRGRSRQRPAPAVPLVAASQLALDCLTGNDRMTQEGDALLEWMAANEPRWRFPSLADRSQASSAA